MIHYVSTDEAVQVILDKAQDFCILAVPTAPLAEHLLAELKHQLEIRITRDIGGISVNHRNRVITTPLFHLSILTDRSSEAGRGRRIDHLFLHDDISWEAEERLRPCVYNA